MQPIFAIKQSKVVEIIQHEAKFVPISYQHEWGVVSSEQELLDAIDAIKKDGEYIRMHRLHSCFDALRSHKLAVRANARLDRVLALCKLYREDISCFDTGTTL